MQLEMKALCERCGTALPPTAEAYICSYECTYCPVCFSRTHATCAKCGGELMRRPRRKARADAAEDNPPAAPVRVRPWLVWTLSFAVWGFIGLALGVSMYQLDRSLGKPLNFVEEFTLPVINQLLYGFLTPMVFWAALRYPLQRSNWQRRLLPYFVGEGLFSIVFVGLRAMVYPVWDPRIAAFNYAIWNFHTQTLNVQWFLLKRLYLYDAVDNMISAYLPAVMIAHAVWYYRNFRDRELRSAHLEVELTKANLQALKSHMQPHFLFNTMHSISSLMMTDVPAADKMMTRLSDLLRMSLENKGVQLTTLNRELEFVNGYLEIEKIRFADRLNVVLDIAPDALDALVPHLLLQPLVENAVKHGISQNAAKGAIRISASHDAVSLHLRIHDNGPGLSVAPVNRAQSGLGLAATRERLQTLYGSEQSFEIENAPEGGVAVSVRIPFRTEAQPLTYELAAEGPEPAA